MKKQVTKNTNINFKAFFGSLLPNLAKMGKSFLLPIALLPIAGIFQGIGGTIAQACLDNNVEIQNAGWYIGNAMKQMGSIAFTNLPILFAVAIAISFTGESGVAALTAIIGFLTFNALQFAFLTELPDGKYQLLFYDNVDKSQTTSNMGVLSLNTGVFAAIFVGFISAYCYKKFYKVQLPNWIGFFSGTKLVPIMTFFMVIPLSFLFMLIWPPIGLGLSWVGNASSKLPGGVDSFVYQFVARSLLPFGLHHILNNVLWYNSPGGDLIQLMNSNMNFVSQSGATAQEIIDAIGISNVQGDQNIFLWVTSGQNLINFADLEKLNMNVGRFLSGRFVINLLSLPMASVAMWLSLPKENRKAVIGIYISSMIACILTGITEPIEYTFLFTAPWLFYGVHVPLASFCMMASGGMQVHTGSVVAAGLIDFILYGLVPLVNSNIQNNIIHFVWIVPMFGAIYFIVFYVLVRWKNVDIPGRNIVEGAKLFTKKDYENKKSKSQNEEEKRLKAIEIIKYVGGSENITGVDACASRLRISLKDQNLVDKESIMNLGGCKGIMLKNNYLQAVYGAEQEILKHLIKEEIKI